MAKTDVSTSEVLQGVREGLPISADATTSRTVVSNDAVRVVAFAMDRGQELTDHSTPHPVVVYVDEGELTFTVGGDVRELTIGDVVYLAPGARHAVVARTPCRFVLIMSMSPNSA
jgi:quercetin dioxygenase-like cupin family protein